MKKPYFIIGGGIIGNAIAREIRLRNLGDVIVLEKEKSLAEHASGRNSGVIHSGINQKPGTLKARMCLEGSKMLRKYCKSYNIPMEECGTLVIARNEDEERTLEKLLEMGNEVGVEGLRIIEKEELAKREPYVAGTKALFSPTGAIVDSGALVNKIAEEARALGASYTTGCKVISIKGDTIITNLGKFRARDIINCAGLYADEVAHMQGIGLEFRIIPFKGEYKQVNVPINSMVYQVPDLRYPFLGVHLTKSIEGKTLAGSTATLSLQGRESYNGEINFGEFFNMLCSRNFWNLIRNKEFRELARKNARISYFNESFIEEVNTILKEKISSEDIKPYRAGIRAQIVKKNGKMIDDFLVFQDKNKNSTHILNAVSPGLTSSFAFARYVVDNYLERR